MKVIIDIDHPAAINFYKNAINILAEKGTEVEIAVRPRGNILSILQKELPGFHFEIIGKYYSSISGKIIGYIERELGLIHYLSKTNFDISTGFGSEICYASRILGKPSVIFEDDYEYKLTFYLSKFAATRFIMPDYIPASGRNIYKYRGLKELAYLHPKYFKPNKKILDQYKLKPNEYVFIREIANTSLNYRKISSRLYEIFEGDRFSKYCIDRICAYLRRFWSCNYGNKKGEYEFIWLYEFVKWGESVCSAITE